MEDNRCEFVLVNGERCSAYKQKGSQFCYKHGQTPEERQLMARQGALSGKTDIAGFGKNIVIKKPRHIRRALVNTLNLLKEGQITPAEANSIAYICGVIVKTFELIEFEERIEEIERIAKERGYKYDL